MALTSDGMTRAQFLHLWRDAMVIGDPAERARLILELGRASVREEGRASTLVVAISGDPTRDHPVVLMPLAEAPRRDDEATRLALTARLVELTATEAYVLMTTKSGETSGVASYLLVSWGETNDNDEVCVVMPYRFGPNGLEEAEPLVVPHPTTTVFSRELSGLLLARH
ncbi:MAG: hypothetical protein ACI9MR_004081 [Myxococcota bacterium]|jgi:hypothetical protein